MSYLEELGPQFRRYKKVLLTKDEKMRFEMRTGIEK